MYDSEFKLKQTGLDFLIKENYNIENVEQRIVDEICLRFILSKKREFSRPDIITAGATILHLLADGYIEKTVIEGRGAVIKISEKGKKYISS